MKLSQEKRDKIAEQILSFLYHSYPQSKFTAEISRELARDEEFIKLLMFDLKNKNLVIAIKKNPKGQFYSRRVRWILSQQVHQTYKQQL